MTLTLRKPLMYSISKIYNFLVSKGSQSQAHSVPSHYKLTRAFVLIGALVSHLACY